MKKSPALRLRFANSQLDLFFNCTHNLVPFQVFPPARCYVPILWRELIPMRIVPMLSRFTAWVVTFNFRGRRIATLHYGTSISCYYNGSQNRDSLDGRDDREQSQLRQQLAHALSSVFPVAHFALYIFFVLFPSSYINTKCASSGRLLLCFQLFPRFPFFPTFSSSFLFNARVSTEITKFNEAEKMNSNEYTNTCRLFSFLFFLLVCVHERQELQTGIEL